MARYLYWKWLLQGTWWMFLVATLNSNSQTKTKPFKTARAELPSLPARFCKIWNANFLKIFTFSQEFLLSWDKDLDFLLAGHWEYMLLLLLEFFPHVILITWGLESGLAKFFFAESVPLWYMPENGRKKNPECWNASVFCIAQDISHRAPAAVP